eukprot:SAG11_NODE_194_length_12858_cov_28.436946_9_plen_64_part_00
MLLLCSNFELNLVLMNSGDGEEAGTKGGRGSRMEGGREEGREGDGKDGRTDGWTDGERPIHLA